MTSFTLLTCPSCGTQQRVDSNSKIHICEHCHADSVIKSLEGVQALNSIQDELARIQQQAIRKEAVRAVRKLKSDIRFLQVELKETAREGTPLDTVRAIGLAVIVLGLAFYLLNAAASPSALTFAATGVATGIFLHSSSALVGKDYYIRKTFLTRLLEQKQADLQRYEKLLDS